MINILLDKLPTVWESGNGREYRLNTDYRIGVQLSLIQGDSTLTNTEKSTLMRELLFDFDSSRPETYQNIPPIEEQEEIFKWFLHGWHHDNIIKKENDQKVMDFDIDQWRIYAGFLEKYHIDLHETDMHYWKFMGLLTCLTECAYTRVIDIRQRKIDPKADKEAKQALAEAKAVYDLENIITPEEQEIQDMIYEGLGGKRKSPEIRKQEQDFEAWAYK